MSDMIIDLYVKEVSFTKWIIFLFVCSIFFRKDENKQVYVISTIDPDDHLLPHWAGHLLGLAGGQIWNTEEAKPWFLGDLLEK